MTDLAAFAIGTVCAAMIIIYAAICSHRSRAGRDKRNFTHLLK